ncbi:MAG: hypothetical protein AAF211_29540, partial [Myxococcota bacterium]
DLAIQRRESDLVGATFGRGFYILDDYSPLREVTSEMLASQTVLFGVRQTPWYVPQRTLGCGSPECVASRGDGDYRAPNPTFGATFTYYLPESLQTRQEARRDVEKEQEKANRDVAFPSWTDIRTEELEGEPAIVLTVTDAEGNVLRQLDGPIGAGFHRVTWDLRFAPVNAWAPRAEGDDDDGPLGVLVPPGTYTVSMATRIDGVFTPVSRAQAFEVVSVRPSPVLPGSDQSTRVAFERDVEELRRTAQGASARIDEVVAELGAIQEVLARFSDGAAFRATATALARAFQLQKDEIGGHETRSVFGDDRVTVGSWLWHARFTPNSNVYGPTDAQRASLERAREQLGTVRTALAEHEATYTRLKDALDAARVPWTPGRPVAP